MRFLYFSACNTANKNFGVSIVQAFYDKFTGIFQVSGWDGGVGFVFSSQNPFFPARRDHPLSMDRQYTFTELIRLYGGKRTPGKVTLTRPGSIPLPNSALPVTRIIQPSQPAPGFPPREAPLPLPPSR